MDNQFDARRGFDIHAHCEKSKHQENNLAVLDSTGIDPFSKAVTDDSLKNNLAVSDSSDKSAADDNKLNHGRGLHGQRLQLLILVCKTW